MNVLLFGVGPLALVGIIVAAFVLVAPGKGAASSLGFQAGPAPTASQSVASTSASPPASSPSSSPSAHKKHPAAGSALSPRAKVPVLGTPSPKAKAKAKATPKPTHKSGASGGVVPHNLGVPNFAGYCQHIGHRTAELIASNAYGWYCTSPSSPIDTTAACDAVYHVGDAVSRFAVFADPYSWQCWN